MRIIHSMIDEGKRRETIYLDKGSVNPANRILFDEINYHDIDIMSGICIKPNGIKELGVVVVVGGFNIKVLHKEYI